MLARAFRLTIGLGLLAIFGLAGYWSVRLAYADFLSRSDSARDLARALQLAPDDAACHLRMAALRRQSGGDPTPELERAARVNPEDYRIWIQLGLESEAGRDYAAAERHLLRAAAASRQFEPRWMLANFYFRRGNPGPFWHWARDALTISYDDPTPIFRLCRQMSTDGSATERIVPDERRILGGYLRFLVAERNLVGARRVAARLLPRARDSDLPDLLRYCDRLLAKGQTAPALEIWNGMCERGLVPYAPLAPEHGMVLTNGTFARDPLGGGFDWRLPPIPGVTAMRLSGSGGLRIGFSGKQPEICEPLVQWVPLAAGREHRLRFEYQTLSPPPPSAGLRWTVLDPATGAELPAISGGHGELRFTPPAGVRLARVALSYRRLPGTTRLEGSVDLRRVSMLVNP